METIRLQDQLISALKKIAWSYIFIYLNINLGTLDILPGWVGYALILSSLPVLAQYEKTAPLLNNIGFIIFLWSILSWIGTAFGMGSWETGQTLGAIFNLAGIVINILTIYFHFQLLTNLSEISGQSGLEERQSSLLKLRTLTTVMQTVLAVYAAVPLAQMLWVMVLFLFANLAVTVIIMFSLFGFKKELEAKI